MPAAGAAGATVRSSRRHHDHRADPEFVTAPRKLRSTRGGMTDEQIAAMRAEADRIEGKERRARRLAPLRRAGRTGAAAADSPVADSLVGAAGDGGGLVFGVIAYAVGMAYLREGSYGIHRWLSAKFVNKVLPRRNG